MSENHSEEHESPIKTPKQLIIVVVLAFIVPIGLIVLLAVVVVLVAVIHIQLDRMVVQAVEPQVH